LGKWSEEEKKELEHLYLNTKLSLQEIAQVLSDKYGTKRTYDSISA